jgi:hypothetical protein
MIKTILEIVTQEKPLHLTPFWQYVKMKQKIKELSKEIGELELSLKYRSDPEFLAYSFRKLLVITKTQNKLLQKNINQ